MKTLDIRYDSDTAPHRQIADWICERITAGEWGDRDRISTEPELIAATGVARETVRRAMKVLREEGWIYTVGGRGSFVRPDRPR